MFSFSFCSFWDLFVFSLEIYLVVFLFLFVCFNPVVVVCLLPLFFQKNILANNNITKKKNLFLFLLTQCSNNIIEISAHLGSVCDDLLRWNTVSIMPTSPTLLHMWVCWGGKRARIALWCLMNQRIGLNGKKSLKSPPSPCLRIHSRVCPVPQGLQGKEVGRSCPFRPWHCAINAACTKGGLCIYIAVAKEKMKDLVPSHRARTPSTSKQLHKKKKYYQKRKHLPGAGNLQMMPCVLSNHSFPLFTTPCWQRMMPSDQLASPWPCAVCRWNINWKGGGDSSCHHTLWSL